MALSRGTEPNNENDSKQSAGQDMVVEVRETVRRGDHLIIQGRRQSNGQKVRVDITGGVGVLGRTPADARALQNALEAFPGRAVPLVFIPGARETTSHDPKTSAFTAEKCCVPDRHTNLISGVITAVAHDHRVVSFKVWEDAIAIKNKAAMVNLCEDRFETDQNKDEKTIETPDRAGFSFRMVAPIQNSKFQVLDTTMPLEFSLNEEDGGELLIHTTAEAAGDLSDGYREYLDDNFPAVTNFVLEVLPNQNYRASRMSEQFDLSPEPRGAEDATMRKMVSTTLRLSTVGDPEDFTNGHNYAVNGVLEINRANGMVVALHSNGNHGPLHELLVGSNGQQAELPYALSHQQVFNAPAMATEPLAFGDDPFNLEVVNFTDEEKQKYGEMAEETIAQGMMMDAHDANFSEADIQKYGEMAEEILASEMTAVAEKGSREAKPNFSAADIQKHGEMAEEAIARDLIVSIGKGRAKKGAKEETSKTVKTTPKKRGDPR